jgi:1-pyrroline-5-carboxylate dehydrogenase
MRLLHYCGLPVDDVDFINSDGRTMNKLLLEVGFPDMIDFLF